MFSQTAQADTALLEKDANDNNTHANTDDENANENRNEGHADSSKRAMLGAAMYRSGARAALRAAIGATQAMVNDSAPLPEAHKAVRLCFCPVAFFVASNDDIIRFVCLTRAWMVCVWTTVCVCVIRSTSAAECFRRKSAGVQSSR